MNNEWHNRTVYIPYMSDHSHVLAAGFRYQQIDAEVLAPTNYDSLAVGLRLCRGRECLPCFTTTGDIMNVADREGFEPRHAALFMPTTLGPCRFGQYATFQREVLDEVGLGEMIILSPAPHNKQEGFGRKPMKLRQISWQGFVAVDLLQSLLYEYRPYEVHCGDTDSLYQQGLRQIVKAVEAGGGKHMVATIEWIADAFERLAVQTEERRPLVGIIGELYLRNNPFSNEYLIQRVEDAGGEVFVANITEWIHFLNWNARQMYAIRRRLGDYLDYLVNYLYQMLWEEKLYKRVSHLLRHPYKVSIRQVVADMRPYYRPAAGLETESVMTLGNVVDFARHKQCCGILHLMPFACVGGTIVSGIVGHLREDLNTIPLLDVVYDTQGAKTNLNTRLEAFLHQSFQFHAEHLRSTHAPAEPYKQ